MYFFATPGLGFGLTTEWSVFGCRGLERGRRFYRCLCFYCPRLAGCDRDTKAAGAGFVMPPPMVSVTTADSETVPEYLDEIGKAIAYQVVAIQPQVSGKITEILFKDGADLKKGQPLFTIDPRPYKAALDQAKATVSQSKAQLELAKIEFKRIKDLPRSVEPQEDYDEKENAIDVASANVAANEAAVETAQINVQYCSIASPFDGRAGQRLADLGNVVNSNTVGMSAALSANGNSNSTLLTIQQLNPIYADFTVDESQVLTIRQRMASGTLKTLVRLPEDKDWHSGSLTFLDNSVQDGSGTIKLRATLENKEHHFWPGQFVNIRLVLQELKGAVVVPTSVPQTSQKGPYVLVVNDGVDKNGQPVTTAEMRPVELGQIQGDMVVLTCGVKAGEKVITDGQMMVRPGLPVKVMGPAPAPKSTTAPSTAAAAPIEKEVVNGGAK